MHAPQTHKMCRSLHYPAEMKHSKFSETACKAWYIKECSKNSFLNSFIICQKINYFSSCESIFGKMFKITELLSKILVCRFRQKISDNYEC